MQVDTKNSSDRRGRAEFRLINGPILGLFGAVGLALCWISDCEPHRLTHRLRLCLGEPGVVTTSFAVSPNGLAATTTEHPGKVTLRGTGSETAIEAILEFPDVASASAFSPDGRFLAVGGKKAEVRLWRLSVDAPAEAEPIPILSVRRLAFSPDGKVLAVSTWLDREIILWDLLANRVRMVLHSGLDVASIAFSPDSRYLATGGTEKCPSIVIWELGTGRPCRQLDGSFGTIRSVAFSRDGNLLASGSSHEPFVRLWNLGTGRLSQLLAGHRLGTNSVAFSPDGTTLGTAGNDGKVRLWSVETGKSEAVLDGQATWLDGVAFANGGRTLAATFAGDNHIRLWDLTELDSVANQRRQLPNQPEIRHAIISLAL
jgi:WD40 repeat protein